MAELPRKSQYRLNEVCEFTDTQPYVLRFWESEFPQLNPARSRSGQPVYSRADIDLVQRIKHLLYEEEYTLADARRQLEQGDDAPHAAPTPATAAAPAPEPAPEPSGPRRLPLEDERTSSDDRIEKARYDAAVEEIEHLRYRLREAERESRVAIDARAAAEERCERAASRLDSLIRALESPADPSA